MKKIAELKPFPHHFQRKNIRGEFQDIDFQDYIRYRIEDRFYSDDELYIKINLLTEILAVVVNILHKNGSLSFEEIENLLPRPGTKYDFCYKVDGKFLEIHKLERSKKNENP